MSVTPSPPPMPPKPQAPAKESRWSGWKPWAIGIAAFLALILVVQNSQKVEVDFIFASTNTPLFFALLIALALGFLIGWLFPRVRKRSGE